MDVRKILEEATKREASDIFIIAGRPLTYKSKGAMNTLDDQRMEPKDTFQFVSAIYTLAERNIDDFDRTGDDDFSFAIPGVSRFRVSTFKQRGSYSAVIRVISFTLPHPSELGIPDAVMELADARSGMILVTGPAGSGKSTTLACLIDKINHEREAHIITLEDPLEFLHRHEKSIVSQREINTDTENYLTALRAALRQSPDVILLGEMRDYETINTAVTAAETGHLIFSSLHTIGATNTIDRIIDVFPASQQHQISIQLASVLQAVVSQKLVPSVSGEMVPAFEIMVLTPAIRNLIREGKVHQIDGIIYTSAAENMIAMDSSILDLYKKGIIDRHTAISEAVNPEIMEKRLNLH
ncbi:MAG: PilT/PilU family type 4a pilus ATPase [Lachnospiraceae bacterium]|nr:PilT/PilU family type 4a pilus ATPase [Lachnospiraceae bacterium]MDD7669059.1 PilT/PilU family type 4a pilus ATPase [Lachnospiraceae bacterium]MDY2619280.1 PilT/PilU family type 4a pilus ATPase [Agathobacter sp.]